jgi:2-dehydro-3-deoxyphosphogluconate aldolase/(4S)-4-hydroxy-2-oxoglutarate aldolase
MNSADVFDVIADLGVVPVVEIEAAADAVPLARILADAGLPILEVTFRTAAAADALARVVEQCPDFIAGAGTLLDDQAVVAAVQAGAAFGVSPGLSARCLAAATRLGLPFIPGAITPSEVMAAIEAGFRHVKFFPAGANGGAAAIRALAAPFATTGLRFMPTGGITPENASEYLCLQTVFAVGGTWIAPRSDIAAHRWDVIGKRARAAVALHRHREEVSGR